MYSTSVEPSNFYARWHGFPLPASNIVSLPLAFVRSGILVTTYGSSRDLGYEGGCWSSTSETNTVARYYNFNPGGSNPLGYGDYYLGFPLRWLNSTPTSSPYP